MNPLERFAAALQEAREAAKATWPQVGEDVADGWRAVLADLEVQVQSHHETGE